MNNIQKNVFKIYLFNFTIDIKKQLVKKFGNNKYYNKLNLITQPIFNFKTINLQFYRVHPKQHQFWNIMETGNLTL